MLQAKEIGQTFARGKSPYLDLSKSVCQAPSGFRLPHAVVSTMANPACRTAVTVQAPGWPAISSGRTVMVVPIDRDGPTLARAELGVALLALTPLLTVPPS